MNPLSMRPVWTGVPEMRSTASILIPAHNAEAWIADTIRSAFAQTWANKAIIIIDDGSED